MARIGRHLVQQFLTTTSCDDSLLTTASYKYFRRVPATLPSPRRFWRARLRVRLLAASSARKIRVDETRSVLARGGSFSPPASLCARADPLSAHGSLVCATLVHFVLITLYFILVCATLVHFGPGRADAVAVAAGIAVASAMVTSYFIRYDGDGDFILYTLRRRW